MGRYAQSGSIIRIFAFALCALAQIPAHAAATAQGVTLSASAGCTAGDLDITITSNAEPNESWLATNLAGATLAQGDAQPGLSNSSGPPPAKFTIPFLVSQPPNTLIGAYANVGEIQPDPSNTAEFFVYYNCSTREILLACFGQYGTCPRTAQVAAAALAPQIPTLGRWALPLTMMLIAAAGGLAMLRRRT